MNSLKEMSPEEEKALGRRILRAEEAALLAIRDMPGIQALLNQKAKKSEKTRAGRVDRLREAIRRVTEDARTDPALRPMARAANAAMAEAESCRWKLAMSGTRVVRREARKLAAGSMEVSDLVQEGHIGLLRAAKRYDPDRDIRFCTYARWWVRAQMTRSLDHNARTVRLPGGAVEALRNMRKAKKEFEAQGLPYTIAELAEYARVDVERAEFLLSRKHARSLDAPLDGDPDARTIGELLADDDAVDPSEQVEQADEVSRMHAAMHAVLSERQRFVVSRRFGLEDGLPRSLSELARTMQLSRERVRQIERQALSQLRQHGCIREAAPAD